MKTKKSNLMVLSILIAISLMLVMAGCKRKEQPTNGEFPETFNNEMEDMKFNQLEESFSNLQLEDSEDVELAEYPGEYPEEKTDGK